jgi:hypothetical protein
MMALACLVSCCGACFAFGVTTDSGAVYINGRGTPVTASAIAGHTVYFSIVSGPGTLTASSDVADSTGHAHSRYNSTAQSGIATIQARDGQTGETARCTVVAFEITQSPDKIFWFAGGVSPNSQPGGYPLQATLTAKGTTTGTFTWRILAGGTYAGFWDSQGQVWLTNPVTKVNSNTVTLRAKAASGLEAVQVKFTYEPFDVNSWFATVWGPHHLERWGRVDIQLNPNGWETDYDYKTKTAWNADFPDKGALGINEHWTTALSHAAQFPNYNWGPYVEDDWSNNPPDVQDHLWIQDGVPPWLNPTPVWGNATLVDWQGQEFRMGSRTHGVGVVVKSHTIEGHLGFGRHNPD